MDSSCHGQLDVARVAKTTSKQVVWFALISLFACLLTFLQPPVSFHVNDNAAACWMLLRYSVSATSQRSQAGPLITSKLVMASAFTMVCLCLPKVSSCDLQVEPTSLCSYLSCNLETPAAGSVSIYLWKNRWQLWHHKAGEKESTPMASNPLKWFCVANKASSKDFAAKGDNQGVRRAKPLVHRDSLQKRANMFEQCRKKTCSNYEQHMCTQAMKAPVTWKLSQGSLSTNEDIEGSPCKTKLRVLPKVRNLARNPNFTWSIESICLDGYSWSKRGPQTLLLNPRQAPKVSQETARTIAPQLAFHHTPCSAAAGNLLPLCWTEWGLMRSELGPQSAGASDKISPCRAESLWNQLNCFVHILASSWELWWNNLNKFWFRTCIDRAGALAMNFATTGNSVAGIWLDTWTRMDKANVRHF